jgi:imidazole glycerol-phosphate synthase subunit HisH
VICVVDYGRGNLQSLTMALTAVGAVFEVSSDPSEVASAGCIVLPGVGAFGDCMAGLVERGLVGPLRYAVLDRSVPFLGICVGMQIMADRGEEFGSHQGLGFIRGVVRRLPEPVALRGATRVPNVGWRELHFRVNAPLSSYRGSMCYFVHSFALDDCDTNDVAATFDFNGRDVPAIVARDRMTGFQFHPEKSASAGLGLLQRFVEGAR